MKFKRIGSLLLILTIFATLLAACGDKTKEDEPAETECAINPELVNAFGEEYIDSEKETIAKLVAELEGYYQQYQKDKDLYAACANLEVFFGKYKESYLQEISDELMAMYKNETNNEKKIALLTLQSQSIGYISGESSCSMYKFWIDSGMTPSSTDEEVKDSFFSCIDSISEFFYCKPITK